MTKEMSAIFREGNSLNYKDRVELFRKYDSQALRLLIDCYMNVSLKNNWGIPEGIPPYKPCELNMGNEGILYGEVRKLTKFYNTSNLNQFKKEMLWIQLLESVTPGDAMFLSQLKDKKLPEHYTKEFFDEVFLGVVNPNPVFLGVVNPNPDVPPQMVVEETVPVKEIPTKKAPPPKPSISWVKVYVKETKNVTMIDSKEYKENKGKYLSVMSNEYKNLAKV